MRLQPRTTRAVAQDLDGDFYAKMLESDQKKYDLAKENLERKKQGLKPLQGDRKGDMTASANVYKQFLAETKQILIDKARELGFEYVATGTNLNGGDMNHFKEAVAKEKEKADKEISEYKQKKQAEIRQLDEEIKDKQAQAKDAEEANQAAKEATKAKDEASREERIARQNAEEAQADSFRKALEKLKSEKQAELDELTEKVVDQNLELEEAKEEKALLEADKDFLREQVQGNLAKISEQSAEIKEQESKISEQEAKISKNEAFMEQQTKKHEEQIDFLARRTKALQEIEQVSKVSYSDKNVVKAFGTVTIGQDHYENLKKKAGLFQSIKRFAQDLVSTIKETSVYKEMKAKLQAEIDKWKGLFEEEKAKNADLEKEKSVLKADNDKLRHDLGEMAYQRAEGKSLGWQIKEYFSEEEQKELEKEIAVRAKKREEEDKQLERDGFSYDR